ncbi:hypothetical protein PXK00_04395 [Phaeobacter sp. QD34_3]|uniref:hypothetical protein n=1 Tax=unclassified Phaeobacter TaxID=2621772 RepID=UPI00237FAE9E|nr:MULTISPECIES: hypothetical protein [unclassified Phaeobacter]MDE4132336.1 hypothetical protein [Phaeobacter sp. QD34_3]MDE4135974.1 hypothetical protein [Phaeobacter sp. QD34_24]MDE4173796.1 hypothetical protein [Phaeobacter sp. PT47_59]
MKAVVLAALIAVCGSVASAGDFSVSFSSWGKIPLCTTGNPNKVGNPEFKLKNLPAGTTTVQFRLTDLDVPGYNHGGSKRLKITADGRVPAGTFTYKSPCPPGGSHTYEWTATARNGGKVLAQAKARRRYPE